MRGFKRRRRIPAAALWSLLALLALWGLLWALSRTVGEELQVLAETEARRLALAIMGRVLAGDLVQGVSYTDLVTYRTDGQGNVTLLQVNTPLVARLAARAAEAVQAEMARLPDRAGGIPLGQFLNIPVLGWVGPRVPVRFVPVGTVAVDLRHRFEEAGINQTRHLVYLAVQAQVRVVVPLVAREVTVSFDLPLAETIIAGRVPQQYWRGSMPVMPASP